MHVLDRFRYLRRAQASQECLTLLTLVEGWRNDLDSYDLSNISKLSPTQSSWYHPWNLVHPWLSRYPPTCRYHDTAWYIWWYFRSDKNDLQVGRYIRVIFNMAHIVVEIFRWSCLVYLSTKFVNCWRLVSKSAATNWCLFVLVSCCTFQARQKTQNHPKCLLPGSFPAPQ